MRTYFNGFKIFWLKGFFLSETLATQDTRDTQDKMRSNQQLAEELHKPIIRKF